MKQITDVSIEKAIVHLVDSKKSKLTLSARELTMTDTDELSAYLKTHIRKSLQDPSARTASYRHDSALKPSVDLILSDPSMFLDESAVIAKHLYDSSDRRISSGAVVVCIYSSPKVTDVDRFLGLLKLDPSDGFHPVEKNDGNGDVYVEFEKVEDVVPSTGEKLLKCAFIKPSERVSMQAGFDMVVLDKQKASSDEPACFFVDKFLVPVL